MAASSLSIQEKWRTAGVAGQFYPAEPADLTATMDKMLAQATVPEIRGKILAVVAPHAGYTYSGPVAAHAYAALKGLKFARVVVIAPSHYEAFGFTSLYDGDGYATPLGTIPVDKLFSRALAARSSSIQLSERGHRATFRGTEHAVEVQLPWLQHVLGNFTLVPIVMSDESYDGCRALGIAIASLIEDEQKSTASHQPAGETLIVASSDLSHYHSYEEARKIDHRALNALEARDFLTMSRNFEARVWEACGAAPVVATMIAAERLGGNRAMILNYANSGDVTGDRAQVVGYSANVFLKAAEESLAEPVFSLSEQEKQTLLSIAQKSVTSIVREHKPYRVTATGDDVLDQERGAFVTLRRARRLRGCIGYVSAVKPLYETVRDCAEFAAVEDPRFVPVTADELPELEYEISVLSPLRHVLHVEQIEIGRHGLLVRNGKYEGILLPQVAAEQRMDRARFLEATCAKAGMRRDGLTDGGTDIFKFSAIVFEGHGNGISH